MVAQRYTQDPRNLKVRGEGGELKAAHSHKVIGSLNSNAIKPYNLGGEGVEGLQFLINLGMLH